MGGTDALRPTAARRHTSVPALAQPAVQVEGHWARPVIFRTREECDAWMTLPLKEAKEFQKPLPDGVLNIVARGGRTDGGEPEVAPRPAALLL